MSALTSLQEKPQDEPVYWFILWESAIERGDYRQAEQAALELRKRGVRVSWTNPAKQDEVSHA
jgi:hypothetical protein